VADSTISFPKPPVFPYSGPNQPSSSSEDPDNKYIYDSKLAYLREKLTEGEAFLSAQPGYQQIVKSIDAIMSTDDTDSFDPRNALSQTRTNRIAKIAEDLAAMMTDTKPTWDYSINNRKFEQHAQIYGKLATAWYQRRNIDMALADTIKYYVVGGTGYLYLYWDSEIGDINACALDPRNVVPIAPTRYDSLEHCQGVIVKHKVPISYIWDRYGVATTAESDGSAITWLNKLRDSTADVVSPIWKFHKGGRAEPDIPRVPTTTIYTAFLKDNRRNTREDLGDEFRNKPVEIGQFYTDEATGERKAANNWSYIVQVGEALFPHRRMIVWVGNKELYDGPSYYWHAQFPIIKLTLNPWPWSWLGKAPCWDLLRLQTSLNRLLRVVDDHAAQVAQPGAILDKNNVSKSTKESLDTRRAGYKIFQNPLAGKGVQIVNPPPLDAAIPNQIAYINDEMEKLAGTTDISQLMNLKQLPQQSTVESIINTMTPGLRFRSRIMEAFMRQVAIQFAYNATEFYTLPYRVAILGPGGITQDDFDFDPGSLLPDYVHPGDFKEGMITPDALQRGPLPRYHRAQAFLLSLIYKVAPGSLLNSAQAERTLLYFQLWRAGAIDTITLLEQVNVPNIGIEKLPDDVRTVLDRLQWCQQVGLMPNVNPAGRKASGQDQPRVVTKES
jgi:hypothetical protein